MPPPKRKIQSTLGAFGIKKFVKHRGADSEVQIPTVAVEEKTYPCDTCKRPFKSQQGLAFHVKSMHPVQFKGKSYADIVGQIKKQRGKSRKVFIKSQIL